MAYTTQQTAKKWKGLKALGFLTMVMAMLIMGLAIAANDPAHRQESAAVMAYGMGGLFLGSCCYMFGRMGAWWFHA